MKKALAIAATLAGAALIVKALASGAGRADFAERIAAMPDTAPPKWIFNNVTAIRANTDRILALLDEQKSAPAGGTATAS
jgi:hypothetical protein